MKVQQRFLRVSEANKEMIQNWKEGISLQATLRKDISDILKVTAIDRWKLANLHKTHANRLMTKNFHQYRTAVSRYYYAMYHAMRACIFIYHQGDDYESHSNIPNGIPPDFPSAAIWKIKFKDARLTRNKADYEPYPKTDKAWRSRALQIKQDADDLIKISKIYLQNKGC